MTHFLRPCSGCRRHVWNDEATCAFCGAAIVVEEPRKLPYIGHTRAAIFATFAACGSPQKVESQPTPTTMIDAGTIDSAPVARPDAATVRTIDPEDDGFNDPRKRRRGHPCPDTSKPCPKMPYGAPPTRRRVV